MESWIVVTVLGLALFTGAKSESRAFMEITQEFAKPGENITITCEITDVTVTDTTYIAKVISDGINEPVATGGVLVGEYGVGQGDPNDPNHRFHFDFQDMDGTLFYRLSMFKVKYEDSARYTCGVVNDQDTAQVTFEVFRNTESLTFYVNGTEVENNTMVDLEEGEPLPINCTASRAVPRPKLHVLSGNRDVTDYKFSQQHNIVPACVGQTDCLLHFYYDSYAYNHMYIADWHENGNKLTCKAILEENEYVRQFEVKQASILLNVTHSPQINCTNAYLAVEGSSKVIKCPLFTNPELLEAPVLRDEDNSLNLKPGEEEDNINFKYTENSELGKPGELQITFKKVDSDHYQMYKINARNVMGDTEFKFRLNKENKDPNDIGSATCNQISILSLVFVAVMALLSH